MSRLEELVEGVPEKVREAKGILWKNRVTAFLFGIAVGYVVKMFF